MAFTKHGLVSENSFTEDTTCTESSARSEEQQVEHQGLKQEDNYTMIDSQHETACSMEPVQSLAESMTYEESETDGDGDADADTRSYFTLTSHSSTVHGYSTPGRKNKRRGDDNASAYSEESNSSQRRRLNATPSSRQQQQQQQQRRSRRNNQRRQNSSQNAAAAAAAISNHRWLENSTRTTPSDAPLKPQRSGDFDFMPTYRRAMTTDGVSDSSTAYVNNSGAGALRMMRCQSMSSPPVRPIRTSDDSDTDLKLPPLSPNKSPKKASATGNTKDGSKSKKLADEYDPDMFARLLKGGSLTPLQPLQERYCPYRSNYTSQCHHHQTHHSFSATLREKQHVRQHPSKNISDPPKRPRRSSDADFYLKAFHRQEQREALGTSAASARDNHSSAFSACITSPKPPAKPQRAIEGLEDMEAFELPPPLPVEAPIPSEGEGASESPPHAASKDPPDIPEEQAKLSPPSPSVSAPASSVQEPMVVEDSERDDNVVHGEVQEELHEDKDEEEKRASPSQEYDPDLFARLLHGETCNDAKPVATVSPHSSTEELPKSHTSPHVTCPYDRFDNAAHCVSKEHLEGQKKSSHPPTRPRRSFDETMAAFDSNVGHTLAAAAAAAVMHHADQAKRPICFIGGKRRHIRPSRRSTMPLSLSQSPSCVGITAQQEANPVSPEMEEPLYEYDPTDETQFTGAAVRGLVYRVEYPPEETPTLEYEQQWQEQEQDGTTNSSTARNGRRMLRRFTMPSKCRADSPLAKKPRISRSVSLKTSEERRQELHLSSSPAA